GFQRAGFRGVVEPDAPAFAITELGGKLFAQPGVVDHNVLDARFGQLFNMPDDQRLAADAQQWLGCVVGQRAHAFAAPRRKNHGPHQKENPYSTFSMRFNTRSKALNWP